MARDYKKEYANYHSRPEQIKRRAARNAARRLLRGRKELTDEKDVHHKDNNPLNNDKSNLSIVTKHYNRREPRLRVEDLRKWFGKGKKGDWVRVGTDGEIKGDCAREPGEGKPKCMPRSKAHSMDKKDRASSARRKRRADPSVDRPGTGNKPIMVKTDKKESVEMNEETAIAHQTPYGTVTAYKRDTKGMRGKQDGFKLTLKTKSGKTVDLGSHPKPTKANVMSIVKNVMQKESVELEEKNVPTNPALWAKMKAQAKAKFDVYPSAYANGWAAKKYKAAGGGWKTESVKEMKTFWDIREGSCGTMNAQTKKDEKPPFEPTRKVGVKKDKFGNVVKDKNRAKHLAKMAMRGENKEVSEEDDIYQAMRQWKKGRDAQRGAKAAGEVNKARKQARRDAYAKQKAARAAQKESYGLHTDRDLIIKAVRIADRKGGSHSDKVREIEKLGKGLSKNKAVATALKQAK